MSILFFLYYDSCALLNLLETIFLNFWCPYYYYWHHIPLNIYFFQLLIFHCYFNNANNKKNIYRGYIVFLTLFIECSYFITSSYFIFFEGIWHRVECEEDSISINISLIVSSYAEIFCSGLQQMLLEYPMFRGNSF